LRIDALRKQEIIMTRIVLAMTLLMSSVCSFAAFPADLITEPDVGTPEQFAALIKADRERVAKLVRQYKWTME
jgi:hypothetical protein